MKHIDAFFPLFRKEIFFLFLTVFFSASFQDNGLQAADYDTAGVWTEVNNGFASCPAVGEFGGVASVHNEKFEVLKLLERRGLMYAFVRYEYGCSPSLYEFDTTINRWRCVARIDPSMNVQYYRSGTDYLLMELLSNGQDIVLINSRGKDASNRGAVWRFTRNYDNAANPLSHMGWEKVSTIDINQEWIRNEPNADGQSMDGIGLCPDGDCLMGDEEYSLFPALVPRIQNKHDICITSLSYVGNSIYAVPKISREYTDGTNTTRYDDLHFRVMKFNVPEEGEKSDWEVFDLPPVPKADEQPLFKPWLPGHEGLQVIFTKPIAGLYGIHAVLGYGTEGSFTGDSNVVQTYDPVSNSWIDLSEGLTDRVKVAGLTSWDKEQLIVSSDGLREWTGYGWKLISPEAGYSRIVTANGILLDSDEEGRFPSFYSEPDMIELRNALLPDPNSIFKDHILDGDGLYHKLASPDNGRSWFATQRITLDDRDESDLQDQYLPYLGEDYYTGIYRFKINEEVSRETYNLHVEHSSYLGGTGNANLAVGVAVTPAEEIVVAGTFATVQGNLHPNFASNTITIDEADGDQGKLLRMNSKSDTILGAVILGDEVHDFDRMRGGDDRMVVSGSWGVTCLTATGDSVFWTLPASSFDHNASTTGYLKVDVDNVTGNVLVMRNGTPFRNSSADYMNKENVLGSGSMWLVDSDGDLFTTLGAMNPGFTYFQDVAIHNDTIVAGGREGTSARLSYFDVSAYSTWNLYNNQSYPADSLRNIHKIDFMKDGILHVLGGQGSTDAKTGRYLRVNHRTGKVLFYYAVPGTDTDKGALHQTEQGFVHLGGMRINEPDDSLSTISGERQDVYLSGESAYHILDMRHSPRVLFDGGFNRSLGRGAVYDIDSRTFGSGVTERQVIAGIGISESGQWITGKYAEYDTTYHLWKFSSDAAMHSNPLATDMNSVLFTHRSPAWKDSKTDSISHVYSAGDTILCPGTNHTGLDFEVIVDGDVATSAIELCTNDEIQIKNITNSDIIDDYTNIYWGFGSDASLPNGMQDGNVSHESGSPYSLSWNQPGLKEVKLYGEVTAKVYDKVSKTCVSVATNDSVSTVMKSIFINVVDPNDLELRGPIEGVFYGVCAGSVIPFSVPSVDGVAQYNWTLSPDLPEADWEIVSKDPKSNAVLVYIGRGSGTVSVRGEAACGDETEPLSAYVNVTGEDNDVLYVASDGKYIIDDLDSAYVQVPDSSRLIGLWKHDGSTNSDFSAWNKFNYIQHHWALSKDIQHVEVAPDGTVWIFSNEYGLTSYDGTEFVNYLNWENSPGSLDNTDPDKNIITDVAFDASGNMWMTVIYRYWSPGASSALFMFDGSQFFFKQLGKVFTGLDFDAGGSLWVSRDDGAYGGLYRFDSPQTLDWSADWTDSVEYIRYDTSNSNIPTNKVKGVLVATDQTIWTVHDVKAGEDFVSQYIPTTDTWNSWSPSGETEVFMASILQDQDDNLWFGHEATGSSDTSGVWKYDGSTWTNYNKGYLYPTWNRSVVDMGMNSLGDIFFLLGGVDNGVVKYDGTDWTPFAPPHGSRGSAISLAVDVTAADEIWMGTEGNNKFNFSNSGNTYQGQGYTDTPGSESFRFVPKLRVADTFEVYVKWPSTSNGYNNVYYEELHDVVVQYEGGSSTFNTIDMENETGVWHKIGEFPFLAGETGYVEFQGGYPDAVMFKVKQDGYSAFDSMMVQKIEDMGYNVTIVPDADFALDQLTCTRSAFISPTADPASIPTEISMYEIPVITSSPEGFEKLRYIGNNPLDRGVTANDQEQLTIVDTGHELAQALTDPATVYTTPSIMSWANPAGSPDKVANYGSAWSFFAYEKEAMMSGFSAPDRQVGLFFYDDPVIADYAGLFTADADSILFYSNCWVQRNCPGYQTITLDDTAFVSCQGSELIIPFTVDGEGEYSEFDEGNEFIVRLSNRYGEFNGLGVYKEVGRVAGTGSGQVVVNLPDDVLDGGNYKIRIESTKPSILSVNVASLTIHPQPSGIGSIIGNTEHCTGQAEVYELTSIGSFTPVLFEWILPENSYSDAPFANDSISVDDPRRVYTKFEEVSVVLTKQFNPLSDGKLRVRIKDNLCGWPADKEENYTSVTLQKYSVPFLVDSSDIGIGYPGKCPGDTLIFNTIDWSRQIDRADYYKWTVPSWAELDADTGVNVNGRLHDTVTHGLFDTVWVQGVNHCGIGPAGYKIMRVDTTLKLDMDSVTGPTEMCKGDRYTYTYHPGYFAAEYSWILPAGVSVEYVNQNSAELLFSVTIPEGMIIAQVENGCGPVRDTLFFTMDTVTNALLITGDGTLDVPTDQWMYDRLLGAGVGKYINISEVNVVDDDEIVCPQMNCYDLIIVSATATKIKPEYKSATVPVVVNNPALLDEFGMATEGGTRLADNLFVFDNTHKITSRTALGDVQVYQSTGRLGGAGSQTSSIPARRYDNAHSFATVSDVDYTNMSYLRNEMMMGGTDGLGDMTTGKRLAFFLADSNVTLSTQGIEIFDRAVCWATNTCDTTLRIQTAELGEEEYCLGDEVKVLFETFPAEAAFNADNSFLVELSDQNGNFFNPMVIGTKDAVNATGASFEVEAQFPENFADHCIQGGDKYRLRVSATSPDIVGGLNGEADGEQYITLKSCRGKNWDTLRIYTQMDTTRTFDFCGFVCDSIEGTPEQGALRFDGTSDYVDLGSSFAANLVGTPLTLETWIASDKYINPDAGQQADQEQVLFYCENGAGELRYSLYIDRKGALNLREGPNAQDNHTSVSYVLDNNNPLTPKHHHIAMVLDPVDANTSNLKIYVDGAARFDQLIVDVFAGKPGRAEAGDSWILGSNGTDRHFKGIMSDARIWNTARTPEQLGQYKNECPPVASTGLIAHYQFDDGAGTTVTDATGNHNGTIVGGVDWTNGKNVPCGINDQDYYFYPELSDPSGIYSGQSLALADTIAITDAALCAGGNQTIIARIPSENLINNGYYKYRMMAYNRTKGVSTAYDAYEEIILAKVRPNSYLIPEETYVKGLNCYGSTDTAAGRVRFTLNIETDSIWLPITYYWTKPDGSVDTISNVLHDWQASADYQSLDTGMYTLHIVDDLGYSETHQFHVKEPDSLALNDYRIHDVLCHGESNGSVALDIIGGTPGMAGYSYMWNSPEILTFPDVDSISKLPTGYYHVMIEDRNRCTDQYDSFFVDEPPLFEIVNGLTYTEDVSIKGLNDGAIHITVRGGTSPFSSVHDSVALNVTDQPDTLFSFTNLYSGFYDSIYLIDGNNCEIMTAYEVYEPGAMRIDSALVTEVSCYGGADGSIWVSTTGGIQPFTIVDDTAGIWNQVGDSTFVAEDLPVGNYFFRVEDQSGAFQQRTYSVTSPDSLTIVSAVTDVVINGLNTGEITVQVGGGVVPLDFLWSHGDTILSRNVRRDTVQQLYAGEYQLIVRDDNRCVKTADFTVEQPPVPFTASITSEDVNCNSFNNGYAQATGHDGIEPFDYLWSNAASTRSVSDLAPGVYSVTITDAFERTAVAQTLIEEPTALAMEETITSPACDAAYGSIEIEISGGTQPIKSVEWSNGDTSSVLSDIVPGDYTVTVTDANNCELERSFTLVDYGSELLFDTIVQRPYCFESMDGRIEILPSGGVTFDDGDYQYEWNYTGVVKDPEIDGGVGTNLDDGRYFVTVTDKNNCDVEISIILNYLNDECLRVASGFTPNGDGVNDYWEIINIDLFPDASIFVFDRWRNIVFSHQGKYENDWDGTMNGKPLPVDTYHYIIKLNDAREPETGQITILR